MKTSAKASASLLAVFLLLLAGCHRSTPSMLVILLDDARPDDLPTLAQDGIHFDQAYVTSPVCGPSRANFITGRFHSRSINGLPADWDDSDTIATCARWEATLTRAGMAIQWDPWDSDRGYQFIPMNTWRLPETPEDESVAGPSSS